MKASKEACVEAQKAFDVIKRVFGSRPEVHRDWWKSIEDFLEAARRKLPTEAAYKRDRSRAR